MKHGVSILLLGLMLAACDGASAPPASPAQAPAPVVATPAPVPAASAPVAPTAGAPATCPDTDFDAFLKRFESSADAQRAASVDPLPMTRIDPDAQPEPAPVTTRVPRDQVPFPVLADAATRQAEGSQLRIESRGDNARDVIVALPDSGAQVHLEFEMHDCWTLVSVDDQSM